MTITVDNYLKVNDVKRKPLISSDYIEGKGDLIGRLNDKKDSLLDNESKEDCPLLLNVSNVKSTSKVNGCPIHSDTTKPNKVDKSNIVEINFYHALTELRADLSILHSYIQEAQFDNKVKETWISLCEWIADFSFSLGRYVALKGKTKHKAPLRDINEMVRVIDHCKEVTGDCENFLYHKHEDISLINKVLIKIRKLESHYEFWVLSNKEEMKSLGDACDWQLLLNRLSSMVFWMLRRKYLEDDIKESQWSGSVRKLSIDLI